MNGLGGMQDISSVKGLGNQVATEPDGNIKVLVHVPELMYHIEEDKGIWCFNRLVTTSKSSSATSSGMMGSLSKGVSGFAGGSAMGGGSIESAIGGVGSMGNVGSSIGSSMFGPVGSVAGGVLGGGSTGSTIGSIAGSMIGGPIGGAIGGAIGGLFGDDDEGSGSDGAYGPLQPGTKVFIRFTENDYNTGNIVGVVHEEEDVSSGGGFVESSNGSLTNNTNIVGGLGGFGNIGGFTNTVAEFGSAFSGLSNSINSISGVLNSAASFSNSILSSVSVISDISTNTFQQTIVIQNIDQIDNSVVTIDITIDDIGDFDL